MSPRKIWIIIATCLIGTTALLYTHQLQATEVDQPLDWKEELKQIDDEIKATENQRDRYLAAARRAEDEGIRWQFMQNQKQEARRAFQRAEDKKQAARMLQGRIDALNARKAQILQENSRGK